MKRYKLDAEEKEILASFERGEWKEIKLTTKERERFKQMARNSLKKDQRINIRITRNDLEGLKRVAVREGMPYQTLVTSVLHRYISGAFKKAA